MTALYVDESKANGYLIVAAAVLDADATLMRKQVAQLRTGKQQRVHFVHESDTRRRKILARLQVVGVSAHVFHAKGLSDREARQWGLGQLVELAAARGANRIVLEMDDSIVKTDRRTLFHELDRRGLRDAVSYSHDRASAEPLLWPPDAIAWSYARGGSWRSLAQPMIANVVNFVR